MDQRVHSNRTALECCIAPSEFDALLTSACACVEASRVDELVEWIEDYDGMSRFVLDQEGESYKNAA